MEHAASTTLRTMGRSVFLDGERLHVDASKEIGGEVSHFAGGLIDKTGGFERCQSGTPTLLAHMVRRLLFSVLCWLFSVLCWLLSVLCWLLSVLCCLQTRCTVRLLSPSPRPRWFGWLGTDIK